MTQDFIRYGTLGGKYTGSPGQIASLFKEGNLKEEIDKPLILNYLNGKKEKWPNALDYISYYIELFRRWAYRQTDGDTALLAEIDDYIKDLYSLIKKAKNSSKFDDVELSRLEALKKSLTEKLGDYIPPRLINAGQDGVNELLQYIENNLYIDSYAYKSPSKWLNEEIERVSLALEKIRLIKKLIKKVSPESREKYLLLNRLDDLESCFIGWVGTVERNRDNEEWTITDENAESCRKEYRTLMSDIKELNDKLNVIVKKNKQQSAETIPIGGKVGSKKPKGGRQKKYTPEILKAMQKLFDDESEKQKDKDVKAAWSKVAEVFNIKSAKAAEMAVRRYQKQNK